MKLTSKLVDYLYRSFSKDPDGVAALSISATIPFSWSVLDTVLTLKCEIDGELKNVTVDLTGNDDARRTIQSVVAEIHYESPYIGGIRVFSATAIAGQSSVFAAALIDGEGDGAYDISLPVFTSPVWAFLDACSTALTDAATNIALMPAEMNVLTATDEWLDELGGYYGVRRAGGESDPDYSTRIIYEVLKPKNNNIAIEEAIRHSMGKRFPVKVEDSPVTTQYLYRRRDGSFKFNGRNKHGPTVTSFYCQFDIETDVDLISSEDIHQTVAKILSIADKFKSAGTRVRQIKTSGAIVDTAVQASEAFTVNALVPLNDSLHRFVRDGSISRCGVANYGDLAESVSISPALTLAESSIADLVYGNGHCPRNGTVARSGRRGVALEDFSVLVTVAANYGGRIPRGGKVARNGSASWLES